MVRVAVTEGRHVNAANDRPIDTFLDIGGIAEWFSARGRPMSKRQAYRLAEAGWPIFKIAGRLSSRPTAGASVALGGAGKVLGGPRPSAAQYHFSVVRGGAE